MIAFDSITLTDSGVWVFTWASESVPSYRIVLNGQLIGNANTESFTYRGHFLDAPPPIEVTLPDELAESEINSPKISIQWYGVTTVSGYRVQEYIASEWVTLREVRETGQYIYTFDMTNLEDESSHLFQVIAYDEFDDESTGADLNFFIVRPQVIVEADYVVTYNGTQIVIAEA